MRLITKYYYIEDIPVIEMIQDSLDNQAAPLVVFYHGFTNTKDGMMTYGNEIAKKGFRVIMPDAVHHGERRAYGLDYNANGLVFFEALKSNVEEFPQIIQYYQKKDLIQEDYIGVAGMSMGGMTTALITKSNPNVKASVILMGSPQQKGFNDWLISQYTAQTEGSHPMNQYIMEKFTEVEAFFNRHDLGQEPQAIASRPVLFWHSKADPVVPYHFAEEFVKKAQELDEGKYVYLQLDDHGGHKVPYKEMARMAEFFDASVKLNKEDIFEATEKAIDKRFG